MNAVERSTVWLSGRTVTNRGCSPSRAVGRRARLTLLATALLVALVLAAPAHALDWNTATVDAGLDVGWWTSIALNSTGLPHISYFDRTNGHLKYATKLLPHLWIIETVDSAGRVGEFSSIALDSSGNPHISYLDFVDEGNRNLKYATRLPGGWKVTTVDAEGDVGWFASIAVDPSGQPHIAYYDFDNGGSGNGKLKYARRSPAGTWLLETVDSNGDVGAYTSIALDSSGLPHISYFDYTSGNLKYARKVCPRVSLKNGEFGTYCLWSKTTVDAGDVISAQTSLALDSSGLPHISYVVSGDGYPSARYARRLASGSWSIETVDTGGVGFTISLALDSDGLPHITYPYSPTRTLKYARKLSSGIWSRETIAAGSTGHNSIALDSSGNPHVSYYDDGNDDLKYAKGDPRVTHLP